VALAGYSAPLDGFKLATEPLSKEEIAELIELPEPEWDDDMTCTDGPVFRLSYERLSIDGVCFTILTQLEQAWIYLQVSFGVKSRLASDPEWDLLPKPTKLSIQ
jgi:hypothetical protein